MFEHRVENHQEFAHAGGQRHLLRLPDSTEPLIEGADHGIETGRDDCTHIEHRTHVCASTPDRPSASQRATVTIQGRDADERRDLLVRQGAELGQIRQQGRGPTPGTLRNNSSFSRQTGLC